MDGPVSVTSMIEQDRQISEIVAEQRSRLRNFIRRRVPDPSDAEDIVQEVFYELVEANRLLMPIEHVTGWLFRVARNRITDLFRKKKPEPLSDAAVEGEDSKAGGRGHRNLCRAGRDRRGPRPSRRFLKPARYIGVYNRNSQHR
jgi:RNA polymerase sigma factor (sigma-70 family)